MAKRRLETPIARRALFQEMVADLQRERERLRERLAEVDAELASYGGAAPKRPGVRGRPRGGSLKQKKLRLRPAVGGQLFDQL